MKTVSIFGATGSVGRKALTLCAAQPDAYRVTTLAAGKDAAALAALARAHNAESAVLADERQYGALKEALAGTGISAAAGPRAVLEAAQQPVDVGVAAIVGVAGLAPTLLMAAHARVLALANKESVVCAGALLREITAAHGTRLVPVDSEHNALFQLLRGLGQDSALSKVTLTASGGPFRTRALNSFSSITVEEATHHPVWPMGQKISVDSATMMNKGLEVIEASYLFDLPPQQIEVLIHPQAAVHALAHYEDGSSFAHVSVADMAVPLGFALAYPARFRGAAATLDIAALSAAGGLSFFFPEPERFPCLRLAYQALDAGLSATITLNAANEEAVAAFLARRIAFSDIAPLCAAVLAQAQTHGVYSLEDVMAVDADIRFKARQRLEHITRRAG